MNKLSLIITFTFLFLYVNKSHAIECGLHKVTGEVQSIDNGNLIVVIAKGTKSEIILETPRERSLKFLAYKDKSFIATFEISKIISPQKAVIKKIIAIDSIVADPLNNTWSKIELIKKMGCEK